MLLYTMCVPEYCCAQMHFTNIVVPHDTPNVEIHRVAKHIVTRLEVIEQDGQMVWTRGELVRNPGKCSLSV